MKKKIRVAVLYGGKSGEHEVSLHSAASVIKNLDRQLFEVIPVSIDKSGRWQWNDIGLIEKSQAAQLPIFENAPEMRLQNKGDGRTQLAPTNATGSQNFMELDVIFPVMHGPLCEDGAIQGFLEIADVAYVGAGVLGSAIGMDKDVAKRLAASAGVEIVPYLAVKKENYESEKASIRAKAEKNLTLPVFVKPANMGSSVGVHKVKKWEDLDKALMDSFQYDFKVLIEQGIDAREVEVAVLENISGKHSISVASEIRTLGGHEFYSYEAKYLDQSGSTYDLPAKITAAQMQEVQKMAADVFTALECESMARVDFFLDRKTNKFYFNEVNTIPGFTSISMYPKMMEASGVAYPELLKRLVELAIHRHEKKTQLKRDFHKK